MRQTHTFATLQISPAAYTEIRGKLLEAWYQHALLRGDAEDGDRELIDMHGIALVAEDPSNTRGIHIDVNGESKSWKSPVISHADVVRLALGLSLEAEVPNLSVTYFYPVPPHGKEGGILSPRQCVVAAEGMRITAVSTTRA